MSGPAMCLTPRFLASCPSFRLYPLPLVDPDLTSFNPSIAAHDGTLYFCVRHANLLSTGNERYGFVFALKDRARDFVNETSFGILRLAAAAEGKPVCQLFPDRLADFEDVRIFRHGGRWFGLACRADRDTSGNFPVIRSVQIYLLAFDDRFRLNMATPLPSPVQAQREKNWVPLSSDRELRLVYRPAPLTVFALDPERRQMSLAHAGPEAPSNWSGGSQFVPFGDGTQLGVIHRRSVLSGDFVYEHAFMRVAPDFSSEISTPFRLLTIGVEFCSGLVTEGDDVLLSFGSHNDSRAFVARLSRADVNSFFSGP